MCICAKETKRSPEKGSDFLNSTKTSQGLLIHKVGIIGQVREQGEGGWSQRETYECSVSLHSSSAISQLPNGKYWFILRSLKGFSLFCFLIFWNLKPMIPWLHWPRRLSSTRHIPMKINHCILIVVPSFMLLFHLLARWSGRQIVTTHPLYLLLIEYLLHNS